jgi:hypothetical protein
VVFVQHLGDAKIMVSVYQVTCSKSSKKQYATAEAEYVAVSSALGVDSGISLEFLVFCNVLLRLSTRTIHHPLLLPRTT